MSYQSTVYQILMASPNDVAAERAAIQDVIHAWNALHSAEMQVTLLPVLWETHSVPEMGERPQAIINRQIVQSCDVLVGAFWTRIGTHTGEAESGTVEEINEFRQAGKPVLLYFSSAPVVPESIDPEQYRRLREFRAQVEAQGLVERYGTVAEFREKLSRHLTATVRRLRRPGETGPVPLPPPEESGEAHRSNLELVHNQLNSTLVRRERDWVTERDVRPRRLDDAKRILRSLASELLDFRALLADDVDQAALETLENAIRTAKALQDHEVYIDGGVSYRQFWTEGDTVFEAVHEVLSRLP